MNQDFITNAVEGVMAQALATGLFVSSATFQRPSGVFDAGGAPDGEYVDIPGLVEIRCMKAINGDPSATLQASQQRLLERVTSTGHWHVLLDTYYSQVIAGWEGNDPDAPGPWRLLVDGETYLIFGAEHDSQFQMTRVAAYQVTI